MDNFNFKDLPDAVKKAMIAEKYKELEGLKADNKKLDETLKAKKNEIEYWKAKTEAKQMEVKYWKENIQRLQAAVDKEEEEIALLDAGIHPDFKDLDRQIENQEAYCLTLKNMWEKYEAQWKVSLPEAIEYHEVLNRVQLKKVNLGFCQAQVRYLEKVNRMQEEVDERRMQLTIIDLAREWIERRDLQNNLQILLDRKEELKANIALLKQSNATKSPMSVDTSNFLMPPPSHFSAEGKDISDTVSINTVVWEDYLLIDNQMEQQPNTSTPRETNNVKPTSSMVSNSSFTAEKLDVIMEDARDPPNRDQIRKDADDSGLPISRHQSYDLAKSKFFKTKSDLSNYPSSLRNCGLSDIAECSSTVNDDLADSSAHQSEFKESANATQQQSEMEYDDDLCACSSSTVVDDDMKQAMQPESRPGSIKVDDEIARDSSFPSMSDFGAKENSPEKNPPKRGPVIRSDEVITKRFQIFPDDFNAGPAGNMFSSQFTLEPRLTADQTDDISLGSIDKMPSRPMSPMSDIDMEYRSDISMTSRHDYGKFSPPNSMTSFVSKLQKDKKGEPSKTQKPQETGYYNFTDSSDQVGPKSFL